MNIDTVILVVLGGFLCEFIDASMGMMYGTILSPVLIIAGFEPVLVVPSILFSQALGPICIVGFLTFLLTKGISDWNLVIFLSTGALLGASFGALLTSKLKSEKRLKNILGISTLLLGAWTLIRTWIL